MRYYKEIPKQDRCHPRCEGYITNRETDEIERCDDCARFPHDDAAREFVANRMHKEGARLIKRALKMLTRTR